MLRPTNYAILVCIVALSYLCTSCNEQPKPDQAVAPLPATITEEKATPAIALANNIRCMLQGQNGYYWFGTQGDGLYRYDGNQLIRFTGSCSDYIISINEDKNGILWLETNKGLCRYDGHSFTDYSDSIRRNGHLYTKGDLLLKYLGTTYQYDGNELSRLAITQDVNPASDDLSRQFVIESTLTDSLGHLWLGTTENGVWHYDGKSLTHLTAKGLKETPVRAIFRDSKGVVWFANDGYGLFRYEGNTLRNLTEELGLAHPEFVKKKHISDASKSLGRLFSLNEDAEGNLWISTYDAGVWRYDGKRLTNYTEKDGLGNAFIRTIYKDKKGDLYFIADHSGIYRFNRKGFTRFAIR